MNRLNPLSDVVFSSIFRDMSAAPAMLDFINAVLTAAGDAPIHKITSLQSQYPLIAELIGKKSGRVDVHAESEDNQRFDWEVQLRSGLDMNERDMFYGGRMIANSMPSGTSYDKLPRIRIINILDYVIRPDREEYLQPVNLIYRLPDANGDMLIATDAFRIYHIQLPLFRRQCDTLEKAQTDRLAAWLYTLDSGYRSESEMEVLGAMTEGLGTFAKKYNLAVNDPRVRALYEYEMSAEMDDATRISSAGREGHMEGRKEGRMEGRMEGRKEGRMEGTRDERLKSIRNLINNLGLTARQAMDALGIPASEQGDYLALL